MKKDYSHLSDVFIPPDIDYLIGLSGAIRLSEGLRLARLASLAENGVIVEIGSYRGQSTCFLASGSKCGHNVPVYAVDCWDMREDYKERDWKKYHHYNDPRNKEIFTRQTEPYKDLITPIQGFSLEVAKTWNKPIAVLFIDGDHDEGMSDYKAWGKWVIPGGYIAFHDYDWPSVRNACERIRKTKQWPNKMQIHSLLSMRRRI